MEPFDYGDGEVRLHVSVDDRLKVASRCIMFGMIVGAGAYMLHERILNRVVRNFNNELATYYDVKIKDN